MKLIIIIIIYKFCIALFSGIHKLTATYHILQHFLSKKKVEGNMFMKAIHTIMATNNVYIHTQTNKTKKQLTH